jgi:hypothetical protein
MGVVDAFVEPDGLVQVPAGHLVPADDGRLGDGAVVRCPGRWGLHGATTVGHRASQGEDTDAD